MDFDPVPFGKSRDFFGDLEVRPQVIGRGTLRHVDQPSCIPHEHRLIGGPVLPQLVEHALNLGEAVAGTARSGIPQAHAQQLEVPDDIHGEERVRVADAAVATWPARLFPQMEAPDHHLRRIDQAVMQARNHTGPEATCPVRFFQLPSQAGLAGGHTGE